MVTLVQPAIDEVTLTILSPAANCETGKVSVTVLTLVALTTGKPTVVVPTKAWYETPLWVLAMVTVALVLLEQTVLPLTVSDAEGEGLTVTAAVSVLGTTAQPAMVDETLTTFKPLERLETGRVRVTVLASALLTTGKPMAAAPTKDWYETFFCVLAMVTVALVLLEQTVLPDTFKAPEGSVFKITPAVSVIATVVQPATDEDTLMMFRPEVSPDKGRLSVTVLPFVVLATAFPIAVVPMNA
jgi:hypothetical protein